MADFYYILSLSFIYFLYLFDSPLGQNNTQASLVCILNKCSSFVTGMHHRGLFRLCSSVVRTRQLRQRWDRGEKVDLGQEEDVPTVASLLKLFFRELPIPVVPEPQRKQLIVCLTGTVLGDETGLTLLESNDSS